MVRIPKKYKDKIAVYKDIDGYWIYTEYGYGINFSGEIAHTINAGGTLKEVWAFLEDYPIVVDKEFTPNV